MLSLECPLTLGSASPRRREILEQLGIPLIVAPVQVDESRGPGEAAEAYLQRVVVDKLRACGSFAEKSPAVLVADTVVIRGAQVLGKPRDREDAAAMIRALSGQEHAVWTRFAIKHRNGDVHAETVRTRVWFRTLLDEEIEAYAGSGEGDDKAGAYAIQGLGAFAVQRIEGSYANVVGLPACEVVVALRSLGLVDTVPIGPLCPRACIDPSRPPGTP